jgi:hypothetical protein
MVFYVLRRDDSLKVALVCALLAPVVLFGGSFGPLLLLQQVAFIGLICSIRFRLFDRSTRFQMALPITGRDLLAARIGGTVLIVWFPLATGLLFLAANHRAGSQYLLQGGAVLTFCAILPLTVQVRAASMSLPMSIGLSGTASAAGIGAWFVLSPFVHFWVFAALSVAFIVRACLLAPAAFEVSSAGFTWVPPRFWSLPAPFWWPLARSAMPWMGALIFLWGYCMAMSPVKSLPYVSTMSGVGLLCRTRAGWLYGLPLSRRVILWSTLAVTAVPFLFGLAAATWIYRPSFLPVERPMVGHFMTRGDPLDFRLHETNVALEYWRHAPSGKVPLIEAPWGETAVPRSISIVGFVFYNPYTATKASSDRFFAWQFENATQALHGRRISYGQYLHTRPGDWPDYPRRNRVNVAAFAALTFGLLFGAYLQELTISRWLSGKRFARAIPLANALLLGAGLLLADALLSAVMANPMPISSLLQALFMRLAALPLPTWALAAIGAVPCLAMYLLLEWQCGRSEIVNTPAVTAAP